MTQTDDFYSQNLSPYCSIHHLDQKMGSIVLLSGHGEHFEHETRPDTFPGHRAG